MALDLTEHSHLLFIWDIYNNLIQLLPHLFPLPITSLLGSTVNTQYNKLIGAGGLML